VALPPDTKGELIAKGRSLTSGYYRNPAQTAATVDADGFFHTGDLCSMDAEGFLLFHGRLKDVLKVGGENVSALEVESFLTTHPAIKLAQIVGVPDDRLMEVPAVFIELTPGSTVEAQEVIDFCRGQIANFKIPRHVRFVTEWPMSSTKIQKFRLRHQLLEELENAPARDGAS
jgi:fatty-acyl-CoA synthase